MNNNLKIIITALLVFLIVSYIGYLFEIGRETVHEAEKCLGGCLGE